MAAGPRTRVTHVLLASYAALGAAVLLGVLADHRPLLWATKPLLAPCLAALLLVDPMLRRPAMPFVAGLGFAAAGDVAMLAGRAWLLVGLGLFLAMHLCYLLGLLALARPGRLAIVVYGLVWLASAGALWSRLGSMRIPVLGYAVALTAMAAAATVAGRLAAVGAGLFVVSDLAIGLRIVDVDVPGRAMIIMATYVVAQVLIVVGVRRRLAP
ncbi:MAG: lysoplasmalogenase [Dactylosporangium sp.]|nr:lysoplasmalogenase [Dactylosporangium sp.]NNJ61469.1 lysoplasmalogenase [Dactylosporangium sp.]